MDKVIVFFRDILDGPLYIVVAFISFILFCSCVGYLAEQNNLKKKAKEKFENSYATVSNIDNSVNNGNIADSSTTINSTPSNNSINTGIGINQSVNNGENNNIS